MSEQHFRIENPPENEYPIVVWMHGVPRDLEPGEALEITVRPDFMWSSSRNRASGGAEGPPNPVRRDAVEVEPAFSIRTRSSPSGEQDR